MEIFANFSLGFSFSGDDDFVPTTEQLAESAVVQRYFQGEKSGTNVVTLDSDVHSFRLLNMEISSDYIFDEPGLQHYATVSARFEVPVEMQDRILELYENDELEDGLNGKLSIGPFQFEAHHFELDY